MTEQTNKYVVVKRGDEDVSVVPHRPKEGGLREIGDGVVGTLGGVVDGFTNVITGGSSGGGILSNLADAAGGIAHAVGGMVSNAFGRFLPGGWEPVEITPVFQTEQTRLERAMEPLLAEWEEIGAENAELSEQLEDYREKVAEQLQKAAEATEAAGKAVDRAETLTEDVSDYKEQLAEQAHQHLQTAEDALREAERLSAEADEIIIDLASLDAEIELIRDEQATVTVSMDQLTGQISDLNAEVGNTNAQAIQALGMTRQLQDQTDELQLAYDALEAEMGEAHETLESTGEDTRKALTAAQDAVDTIANTVDIGTSALALIPGTARPRWSEGLGPVSEEDNPLGLPDAYLSRAGESPGRAAEQFVRVDPGVAYRVSFWAKASEPGSAMVFDMRDQDGTHAFNSTSPVDGAADPSDARRPFWIRGVPTEWTYYEAVKTFNPDARYVKIGTRYFRHAGGDNRTADQYLADFRIEPIIPSQADVDAAQNLAIDALAEGQAAQKILNENQDKWNEAATTAISNQADLIDLNAEVGNTNAQAIQALGIGQSLQAELNEERAAWESLQEQWNDEVEGWQAMQEALNVQQREIDQMQDQAIQSNTAAIRLAFPHVNLVPVRASDGVPYWAVGARTEDAAEPPEPDVLGDEVPGAYRGAGVFDGGEGIEDAHLRLTENMDYKITFMFQKHTNSMGHWMFELRDRDTGEDVITAWRHLSITGAERWFELREGESAGTYFAGAFAQDWQTTEIAVRVRPGAEFVRPVLIAEGQHPDGGEYEREGEYAEMTFHNLHVGPFFPLQEQLERAQNQAIEALADAQDAYTTVGQFEQVTDGLEQQIRGNAELADENLKTRISMLSRAVPRFYSTPVDNGWDFNSPHWNIQHRWHSPLFGDKYHEFNVEAKGNWTGYATLLGERHVEVGQNRNFQYRMTSYQKPDFSVTYMVDEAQLQQYTARVAAGGVQVWQMEYDGWTKVGSMYFSSQQLYDITFSINWSAATYDDTYRLRIGHESGADSGYPGNMTGSYWNNLGPLTPLGDGRRTTTMTREQWRPPISGYYDFVVRTDAVRQQPNMPSTDTRPGEFSGGTINVRWVGEPLP